MSIVSAEALCRHFLKYDAFQRTIGALPHVMNYFERGCLMEDANCELFSANDVGNVVPEFLMWACTGSGVSSARRCYEVLETYGDTILKLAATLLAYGLKRNDPKAGEGDIENAKVIFVTNFHVFRIGYHNLRMHRFMRIMRDPEAKEWPLPLQGEQKRLNACPGKSLSDTIEALIGAHFLTNDDLCKTLQWISDIKLVPLEQSGLLSQLTHAVGKSTYDYLKTIDLLDLPYDKDDDIRAIYSKYYDHYQIQASCSADELLGGRSRFFTLLDREDKVGAFGSHINAISHLHGQMFISQVLRRLQKLQTEVLNYKFKDPMLLMEAMTHKTGRSHFNLPSNYEKLEILGDAILDYLANSNLLRFTLFERYLESSQDEYKFSEDFLCGDAH